MEGTRWVTIRSAKSKSNSSVKFPTSRAAKQAVADAEAAEKEAIEFRLKLIAASGGREHFLLLENPNGRNPMSAYMSLMVVLSTTSYAFALASHFVFDGDRIFGWEQGQSLVYGGGVMLFGMFAALLAYGWKSRRIRSIAVEAVRKPGNPNEAIVKFIRVQLCHQKEPLLFEPGKFKPYSRRPITASSLKKQGSVIFRGTDSKGSRKLYPFFLDRQSIIEHPQIFDELFAK